MGIEQVMLYYDENGKINKYNPDTEEWIPVDQ